MPYEYKGRPKEEIEPKDELPLHLQHRPVYALPYEHFDGPTPEGTDVRYISVGLAQWNAGQVSLKIFRHTGEGGKWTRQSEEMPLTRAIDAVIFLAKVLFDANPNDGAVVLPAGTLEGQIADLVITREQEDQMIGNFDRYLKDDETRQWHKARFRMLYETLDKLVRDGKL